MCLGGGGGSAPQPAPVPLSERESYLSSLNDQQIANIELQRQQWDQGRINSANPVIDNLITLQGQDDSLQGLSNQSKQIAASYVTQGNQGGGNDYAQQQSDLNAQIAQGQNNLNAVTNTPFNFQYTPQTSDQWVQNQDAFAQQEQNKSSQLQSDFGLADSNYTSLLNQYTSSVQSLKDQMTQNQQASNVSGSAQSAAQSVTGNNGPAQAPSFSTNNPKLQQAALLGVAPLNQLNPTPQNNTMNNQTNLTGASPSATGNTNIINNN